jgi:hypothetical protein
MSLPDKFPGFQPSTLSQPIWTDVEVCDNGGRTSGMCPTAAHCGTITRGPVPAIEHPATTAELSGRGTGHNRRLAAAQPDATEPVSFTESTEDDFVSIFQKFPLLSRRQRNWILATRG